MRTSPLTPSRSTVERGVAFYAVGALGLLVQLVALGILAGPVGLHYLPATAVAVELAVLHNFIWHERWTWLDRTRAAAPGWGQRRAMLERLARFHAANGVISIWVNVVLTGLFVHYTGTHYLVGNVLAVAICSLVNFAATDRLVYTGPRAHRLVGGP